MENVYWQHFCDQKQTINVTVELGPSDKETDRQDTWIQPGDSTTVSRNRQGVSLNFLYSVSYSNPDSSLDCDRLC